jgi:hypothetical protein
MKKHTLLIAVFIFALTALSRPWPCRDTTCHGSGDKMDHMDHGDHGKQMDHRAWAAPSHTPPRKGASMPNSR